MTQTEHLEAPYAGSGRFAAFTAYALYLLSIPSAALFAPAGLIVAYAARGGAGPLARSHLDEQIRLFWIAFWWGLFLAICIAISWVLTLVLIGFPLLWIFGGIAFLVMVWFTVMSAIGMIKLLDGRPA